MNIITVNARKLVFLLLFFMFSANASPIQNQFILKKLQLLETKNKVRIGVSAWDMQNNRMINYHAHERFAMDSTSKLMTVAAVLYKAQYSSGFLNKKMSISHHDVEVSGYAPVTSQYVDKHISISNLCQAAMVYSDNTAANLLMSAMRGPTGITRFAHSIGDKKFYLVRWEPDLNSAVPGDKRDTTTPYAMALSLRKILFENLLNQSLRNKLVNWMKQCKTGAHRIRAAVPQGWSVGDKTGTGSYGSISDVAIVWPPKVSPLIITIYVSKNTKNAKTSDQIIASIAKVVIHALIVC